MSQPYGKIASLFYRLIHSVHTLSTLIRALRTEEACVGMLYSTQADQWFLYSLRKAILAP